MLKTKPRQLELPSDADWDRLRAEGKFRAESSRVGFGGTCTFVQPSEHQYWPRITLTFPPRYDARPRWTTATHGSFYGFERKIVLAVVIVALGRRRDGAAAFPHSQLARLPVELILAVVEHLIPLTAAEAAALAA
jgi:hypothetical protein